MVKLQVLGLSTIWMNSRTCQGTCAISGDGVNTEGQVAGEFAYVLVCATSCSDGRGCVVG